LSPHNSILSLLHSNTESKTSKTLTYRLPLELSHVTTLSVHCPETDDAMQTNSPGLQITQKHKNDKKIWHYNYCCSCF